MYRARKGSSDQIEDIWSMYHIPFNLRSSVESQRFSIPGLPCLYLGKSVYTCWMELKQPSDLEFYVSRARVDDKIKIFNLAVNISDLINFCGDFSEKDLVIYNSSQKGVTRDEFILNHLKIWVLSFASSFKIKQESRQFKSDYIIPQLVMLALKQLDIPAVAYLGKTFPENECLQNFAKLNINIAIIMDKKNIFKDPQKENEYSNLMNSVHLLHPINFAQFKNIKSFKSSEKVKSDNAIGSPRGYVSHRIRIAGMLYKLYDDTYFCEFERYMGAFDIK